MEASPYAQDPAAAAVPVAQPSFLESEAAFMARIRLFFGIQVLFLFLSVFTGGMNFRAWSMLDSALLIVSMGMSGLTAVLERGKTRTLAFDAAIALYVLAIIGMGVSVVTSGVVGWKLFR